jgi:hypothetical protein
VVVDVLTTAQAGRVAGIDERNAHVMVPRLVGVLDGAATHNEDRELWSAGEVIAIAVVRALDPHGVHAELWAEGATRVGDAHSRGLCPAYLVTAGGAAFGILFDDEGADVAAARLLMRLAGAGRVVRVVAVAPIVELLCDVLGLRASA